MKKTPKHPLKRWKVVVSVIGQDTFRKVESSFEMSVEVEARTKHWAGRRAMDLIRRKLILSVASVSEADLPTRRQTSDLSEWFNFEEES